MKKMTKKTRKLNKMVSIMLVLVLTLSLIGCASTTPVTDTDEDVIEQTVASTESTETVESTEAPVESSNESTTETVVEEEKPAETPTPKPTTKPATESTEKPETPQTTATPEPTQPPHTHEYEEAVTKQPTCAEAGVKTLTCSCGDVKTEAIPATGNHNWVVDSQNVVHHEALGHVQQVQTGTTAGYSIYECVYCGHQQDHPLDDHLEAAAVAGEPPDHAFSRTMIYDYPGEPIYEDQWVIDQDAWDEVITTYKCSVCGIAKP